MHFDKTLKFFFVCVAIVASSSFTFGNESKMEFDSGGYNLLTLKPLAERQVVPEDVAIAVWPSEIIDAERTHYLNRNSITSMILTVANPAAKEFEKGWIVFDLPVSVELKLTNNYLTFHLSRKKKVQENIKYISVLNEAANVIGRDMVTELEKQSFLTTGLISRTAAQSVSKRFASPAENNKKLIESLTKTDKKKAVERLTDIVGRVAVAKKVIDAPQLDGKFDDICWRKAGFYNNFRTHQSLGRPKYKTSWTTVYKDNTLYPGVDCKQNMALPVAMALGRDGKLWKDTSVEIFLNQSNPISPKNYLQIIVNTNGEIFDSYNEVISWNEIKKAKIFKSRDGWSFELAIPLDKIDVDPGRDQVLRINVSRNVAASKYNMVERSEWFPVSSANKDLMARGWLFLRE